MKPETAEWMDKAEGDWKVVQREMETADPAGQSLALREGEESKR